MPKEKKYVKTNFGNWQLAITRNMPLWHQWITGWAIFHFTKDFGVRARAQQLSVTIHGTKTSIFLLRKDVVNYSKAVFDLLKTPAGINKLKSRYQEFADKLIHSLAQLHKELNLSNWDNFIDKYAHFSAGLFITTIIGKIGTDKLITLLRKQGFPEKNIPSIIGAITYPDRHSPMLKSQLNLLKIGIKVQQGISNEKKNILLKQWLKNYGFIPVNYCENPWGMNDAKKQLDELLQKNCIEELTALKQKHQKKLEEKNYQLQKINNKQISILAQAIAEGTFLNEFRKNIFSQISLGYRDIFKKIAQLGNSKNWRDCFYLLPDEMRLLIKGSNINIKKIIAKRKIVGYYPDDKGVNHFIKKASLQKFVNLIILTHGQKMVKKHISSSKIKIIKGFSANPGVIKGMVKIVLSSKDFHKIKQGDILVTTMTSVDFVPVMEKAGAFITNEGGITSHAAIIAREINKACVIGTRNATSILKDGDLVEVNANQGLIKILKPFRQ